MLIMLQPTFHLVNLGHSFSILLDLYWGGGGGGNIQGNGVIHEDYLQILVDVHFL